MRPLRASAGLYVELLVVAVLGFVFLVGWVLSVSLRAWYVFIGSYLISRVMIWLVADVLKVRLIRPLFEAMKRRNMSPLSEEFDSRHQADSLPDYSRMDYRHLRGILKDSNQIDSLSNDRFRLFALAYICQVQKKIHVHHFMLGIPLMPITWTLYFYDTTWGPFHLGMMIAGFTFALFMSEFWQLLTQEWGP